MRWGIDKSHDGCVRSSPGLSAQEVWDSYGPYFLVSPAQGVLSWLSSILASQTLTLNICEKIRLRLWCSAWAQSFDKVGKRTWTVLCVSTVLLSRETRGMRGPILVHLRDRSACLSTIMPLKPRFGAALPWRKALRCLVRNERLSALANRCSKSGE